MTTFTIDCDSCPARGRLCGDCFVPVLGRVWLETPSVGATYPDVPDRPDETQDLDDAPYLGEGLMALDSDELAAVSAFVRAGLVHPDEAARAGAEVTSGYAVG